MTREHVLLKGNEDFILEILNEEDVEPLVVEDTLVDDEPLVFKNTVVDDVSLRDMSKVPGTAVNRVLGVFDPLLSGGTYSMRRKKNRALVEEVNEPTQSQYPYRPISSPVPQNKPAPKKKERPFLSSDGIIGT